MLKALLHRKLGRVAVGVDEGDGDEEDAAPDGLTGLEDPLTASVFERLAYLPPEVAWGILRGASKPLGDGPAMPAAAPAGEPSWSFWPSLRPGEHGHNKKRVEPDVLVSWSNTVLLIEAKHRGLQEPTQWVEQIRAVREAPAHARKQVWFIAVGGIVMQQGDAHLAHVGREIPRDIPGLCTMRWEDLREVLYSLDTSALPSGQSALLRDVALALETWGYRRKAWFSSLPTGATRLRAEDAMRVLQAWGVR